MGENVMGDAGKQAGLKAIIAKLHSGMAVSEVKREFAQLIKGVSAEEIAAMEQSLIDEGFPAQEIQRLCEVHVQVFESALEKGRSGTSMSGHPAHSLKAENREAEKRLRGLLSIARSWSWKARIGALESTGALESQKAKARAAVADLGKIIIHYARKENQLFPFLERHGFTGPSKVMWGKHDEIRAAPKALAAAADEGPGVFRSAARSVAASCQGDWSITRTSPGKSSRTRPSVCTNTSSRRKVGITIVISAVCGGGSKGCRPRRPAQTPRPPRGSRAQARAARTLAGRRCRGKPPSRQE